MPDVRGDEVRDWFEPDGSLLDGYVFETTVADWQALVDLVRSRGWWFDYLEEGRSTRLPHRVADGPWRRTVRLRPFIVVAASLVGSTSALSKTLRARQIPSTDWPVTPSLKGTGMPPCG